MRGSSILLPLVSASNVSSNKSSLTSTPLASVGGNDGISLQAPAGSSGSCFKLEGLIARAGILDVQVISGPQVFDAAANVESVR